MLAKAQGHDIRIKNGIISKIWDHSLVTEEKIIDTSECVVYPAWLGNLFMMHIN